MSDSSYRIIGCPVRDPNQPIEHNDSLAYPRQLPDGRMISPGRPASEFPNVVGVPVHIMVTAGFTVYEQWLCEVREHKVVRRVARVLGPAFALEEKPAGTGVVLGWTDAKE